MADVFAAIDFSTVAVAVGASGIAVVGIALVMQGITIAKRVIRKA